MIPFGLDRQKPRHYRDMARILCENRDQFLFGVGKPPLIEQ